MDIVREAPAEDGFTRASVYIAGRETGYRHAGRGRPVLILSGDDSIHGRLAAALSSVARVIVPERIEGDDSTSTVSWIRGLLDGLGLERAGLVADKANGLVAITLALADPFRVDRVALLVDGEAVVDGVGMEERLESTGQRVLIVGRPAGARDTGATAGPAWIGRLMSLMGAPE
jgi:hypothetical protein